MFEDQEPPQYYKEYPFRCVRPYQYTYKTFAKARWLKRELFQVLTKQFKAYDAEYYSNAIKTGNLTVNGKIVEKTYVIQNGDAIIHKTIRNQPPVLDLDIEIIHEDEDFVVVNKPPSMIVHTGGGHHFNTLMAILHYEMGYIDLNVLHRLDKCTSGILFLAKNKAKVSKFHEESQNQTMKKMYVARVGGKFPWEERILNASIECISHKDGIYKVFKETAQELNQEIQKKQEKQIEKGIFQHDKKKKKGIFQQANPIKDSCTKFKLVWYDQDSDSSLLECYPITGRTHQIRVHLQYLGFPILNDIVYGGKFIGNGIISFVKKEAVHQQSEQKTQIQKLQVPKKKIKLNEGQPNQSEQKQQREWDYITKPWQICLHSLKYIFQGKEYLSVMPYWAKKEGIASKDN